MQALVTVASAMLLLAWVAAMVWLLRRVLKASTAPEAAGAAGADAAVRAAWRHEVGRSAAVFWVGLAALLALGVAGLLVQDFHRLLFLAPAGAAAASMLVAAVVPPARTQQSGPAQADLRQRGVLSGTARGGVLLAGCLAAGLAVLAVATGLLSVVDDTTGTWQALPLTRVYPADITFDDEGMVASAMGVSNASFLIPFPGWNYGVPLLGLLVLSIVLVVIALRRNADRRRWQGEGAEALDSAARELVARVTSLTLGGLLAISAAALLGWIGNSAWGLSGAADPMRFPEMGTDIPQALPGLEPSALMGPAVFLLALAVVVALVAVSCLLLAGAAWVRARAAVRSAAQGDGLVPVVTGEVVA